MIERDMEKGLTSLSQNHYGEDSVALSTSEAEYMAASEGDREVSAESTPDTTTFADTTCVNLPLLV
jgi:hypothetical protein